MIFIELILLFIDATVSFRKNRTTSRLRWDRLPRARTIAFRLLFIGLCCYEIFQIVEFHYLPHAIAKTDELVAVCKYQKRVSSKLYKRVRFACDARELAWGFSRSGYVPYDMYYITNVNFNDRTGAGREGVLYIVDADVPIISKALPRPTEIEIIYWEKAKPAIYEAALARRVIWNLALFLLGWCIVDFIWENLQWDRRRRA
jgi:hypothetical protein